MDMTIMLVCASGMSTSILVNKMKSAATEKGLNAEIFAVSANEADSHLADKKIDILLLGPQVRYLKSQFEKKVSGSNTKLDVINMQDYGMMNGQNVLDKALALQ